MNKEAVPEPIEKVQEEAREETVSARLQRERAALFQVALLAAIVAFAMLTFLVKTVPSLDWDLQVTRAIQSLSAPWFAGLMSAVSWPGFPPQSILLVVLAGLLIYTLGLKWEAGATVIAAALSGGINQLVKILIQRPRPAEDLVQVIEALDSYSFPSGHVMFYLTFFGFLWFLGFTLLKPSYKRTLLLAFLSMPVLLVGISRIYLGQHWFSDVLGAYLLGSLVLAGSILLYRWRKKRESVISSQ